MTVSLSPPLQLRLSLSHSASDRDGYFCLVPLLVMAQVLGTGLVTGALATCVHWHCPGDPWPSSLLRLARQATSNAGSSQLNG